MDILENITNQVNNYKRGLITNTEMIRGIINICYDEMPRMIEYRKGNKGNYSLFSDRYYTKEEAAKVLEEMNYNTAGLEFRAILAD